jgi:hypothetical protein
VFETLGAFLLRALTKPIAYFQATMDAAMQGFFAGIAKIPGLRDKLGISKDFKPESWDELVTKRMGDIPTMAAEAEADSAARMAEALAKLKPELAKFWMDVTGFASRAPKASGGGAAASQAQTLGAVYQVQRVALEKMGFVMRGGSANDPAMQTAKNTGKLVNLMGRLVAKTGGGMIGTGEPLNAIR